MNIFRFTGWKFFFPFKWSILKQIKPNNNFIILSFLSLKSFWLPAFRFVWFPNEFVVANVALNGLKRSQKKKFVIKFNPSFNLIFIAHPKKSPAALSQD